MADDDAIQKNGSSKWLWFAVIVVLAVAAVIVFLNADGDEPALPDSATTTQEERLNTDLDSTAGEDATATTDSLNGGEAAMPDTQATPAD
ncbi:hypothetical protein AAJ72_02095 [Citromicrobium sp. RCC1885]|uniref:hypothetical protein n=1 Tax=unclassified Citromicrobium TaxID=2630544 RepID=UPI0006C90CC3|nr:MULTISPECIES: hypothetical protein [unclassified Citromicrobium]KPM24569.1 hypothetical protein AAJ72_02095 [Citromicrobium sp. RCC1885]KPM27811.1 hypothetical protein AAJ74_02840 [Citromicrobium sp. RCC1878]MAO05774.1 hypothetical protein [Citromicrobium sp.]OAM10690.1 hypothetical protein A0U43_06570 [Citromicrobium sp. RCC1897]|tara:strand:+ start:120 stop:389 length:270 start_codon:yes stop_codon:yes gene_type:complete